VAFVRRRDAETPGGVSVAINLLFSYVEPRHELQLAEAVRRELPTVPVSISSEVAPFVTLLGIAIAGGVAIPKLRRAAHRLRAAERRVRTLRERQYSMARRRAFDVGA